MGKKNGVMVVCGGCKWGRGRVSEKGFLGKRHGKGDLEEVREEACRYLGGDNPGPGNSLCKGPEARMCLVRRPMWQEGRRGRKWGDKGREVMEDLGFCSE